MAETQTSVIKRMFTFLAILILLFSVSVDISAAEPSDEQMAISDGIGIGFVQLSSNENQSVYLLPNGVDQVWVTVDSFWITHYDTNDLQDNDGYDQYVQSGINIKFTFPAANPEIVVIPEQQLPGKVSILKGNNPSEWIQGAVKWGQIRYKDLYPGVDFVIRSSEGGFEWEYEIAGEVAPSDLLLCVEYGYGIIQGQAQSLIESNLNDLRLPSLGIKDRTTGDYLSQVVQTDAAGDRSSGGNIDYSTFLGGLANDIAKDVAVDAEGNIFVIGTTPSSDFPVTPGAFENTIAGTDAFAAKIDVTASPPELAYATFIGGSGTESANRMSLENGVVYLTGETDSSDFPGSGGPSVQVDAFVAAVNQTGTNLIYSRLLGGSDDDKGFAIAVENGSAYITGITYSSDFPTTNSSTYTRDGDVFVVKLEPGGTTSYAILKGTNDVDAGHGIDVRQGMAWLTGETWAKGFTSESVNEGAVFVMGLTAAGEIDSARVFDGIGDDRGFDLALDSAGLIYVTGFTFSADFPTMYGSLNGLEDAFVLVLDQTTTLYSTFLGGSGLDQGQGIVVDAAVNFIVAGNTDSIDFPITTDAVQPVSGGGNDGFICRYDLDTEEPDPMVYSSYLGGEGNDFIEEVETGAWGSVYLVGSTRSADFPVTSDALSQTLNGTQDAFITKISIFPLSELKLVKVVTNDDGGGAIADDWTLTATAEEPFEGQNFSYPGGSGSFIGVFSDVVYTLSESGPGGYIAGEWICDGGDQVGSTITLALDEQVTCTISNDDDAPTLKLVKDVINDDGGTAVANDWTFSATAEAPNDGRNFIYLGGSGDFEVVYANVEYEISESASASYSASEWVCDGGSLNGSIITLSPGEDVVCTITNNDDTPQLKLVNEVTNDDGGDAITDDWMLYAAAAAPDDSRNFSYLGGSGGFEIVYADASYSLSASALQGYGASAWTCDGGSLVDSTINLALGEQVTCTIVNDDEPPLLKLVKEVVNDDGGTESADDWTLSAIAVEPYEDRNFSYSGDSNLYQMVYANIAYDLSESVLLGYTSGDWVCNGGNLNGSALELVLGEEVICTLTNDDIAPTLKLIKEVTNDDGGTAVSDDWILFATATGPNEDRNLNNSGDSGISEVVYANVEYDLSESTLPGYASEGWICDGGSLIETTITLSLGEEVTCTIMNDDETPRLKLVKEVMNLDEGEAVANDWTLYATAEAPDDDRNINNLGGSGDFVDVYAGIGYALSESVIEGYFQDEWSCDGGYLQGSTIILGLGDQVTCSITNWDNAYYPAVNIQSYTNGLDSDIAPGEYILQGNTVNWTYLVSNTGGVTLTEIDVSDDVLGEVDCPQTTLPVGEQMTCTASPGSAVAGQFNSLGRVTAYSPFFDIGISDQDTSHYFGALPSLSLVIRINGVIADAPPGLHLNEGDEITWSYEVTNDGNVSLTGVSIVDNNGTPEDPADDILVCTIPDLSVSEVDASSCFVNSSAKIGLFENTAVVTGTPPENLGDISAQKTIYYYSVFQTYFPLLIH